MGHCIQAIIGAHKDILVLSGDWIYAKEIRLPQGYGMVFLTDALLDDIGELSNHSEALYDPALLVFAERTNFTAEAALLLWEYSLHTKLAYIETDYFGGVGTQAGVLYENGHISMAPREGEGSINLLLRSLGVWRTSNQDEFDSLCLGRYRNMKR